MHDETPDLNNLLARLRSVAATLENGTESEPFTATPWRSKVAAGGQAPSLYATGSAQPLWGWLFGLPERDFLTAAYRYLMKREPDVEGLRFWLQRLGMRAPRLEVWAQLAMAAEVAASRKPWWARCLLLVLNPARPRAARILRALLRRLEGRVAKRHAQTPLGMALTAQRDLHAKQEGLTLLVGSLETQLRTATQRQDKVLNQLDSLEQSLGLLKLTQTTAAPPTTMDGVKDYLLAFERHFRGEADTLAVQQAQDYMPWVLPLKGALQGLCLDLGCGRGVWLDVLRRHGFAASGVDLNAEPVREARQRGLDAHCEDAMTFLKRQEAGSAMLVTAFHLVEHLPFALRLNLVAECARVLAPGGLLILETPNPENVWVGTHTFYHDPTHSQPLTPDGLAFMVEYHGLRVLQVPRLHPYPAEAKVPETDDTARRLNGMTCCGQDFAVVAQKPHLDQ